MVRHDRIFFNRNALIMTWNLQNTLLYDFSRLRQWGNDLRASNARPYLLICIRCGFQIVIRPQNLLPFLCADRNKIGTVLCIIIGRQPIGFSLRQFCFHGAYIILGRNFQTDCCNRGRNCRYTADIWRRSSLSRARSAWRFRLRCQDPGSCFRSGRPRRAGCRH